MSVQVEPQVVIIQMTNFFPSFDPRYASCEHYFIIF